MTVAEILVKVLSEKKMTCATVESCTGGGVRSAAIEHALQLLRAAVKAKELSA